MTSVLGLLVGDGREEEREVFVREGEKSGDSVAIVEKVPESVFRPTWKLEHREDERGNVVLSNLLFVINCKVIYYDEINKHL